jgi:hypothetical protein
MQTTPTTRTFTQKDILRLVCKVAGLMFILQTLMSVQRIISVGTINIWSQGSLGLGVDLLSNAIICWVLLSKAEWIAERLDVSSDEIRVAIGKQELLEIVVIIVGFILVITAASTLLDNVVHYIYISGFGRGESQGIGISIDEFFWSLFTLAGGLLIVKHHKRVINWVSKLPESTSSD